MHVSRRRIINALQHMHARVAFARGVSDSQSISRAARLQKRTGAHTPSRIKKGMSAAVLFRRVSMNGLVSHGPNERTESGAQHPSAHVKCADYSIAKGANQRIVSQENAVHFSPFRVFGRGRKTATERLQKRTAAHRLPDPAGSRSGSLSRHCWRSGAFKNSGPSPSARARTPNTDVKLCRECTDGGVGSNTQE